ncbi:MAG TPA: hypothetical protein VN493_18850 [Thermoanaerobaculia bacterium]|nr:hypothetical protein [Thermoanaerobaculia bacterium]
MLSKKEIWMTEQSIGELLEDEAEKQKKTLLMANRMIDLARKEQRISEEGLDSESESTGSATSATSATPLPDDLP